MTISERTSALFFGVLWMIGGCFCMCVAVGGCLLLVDHSDGPMLYGAVACVLVAAGLLIGGASMIAGAAGPDTARKAPWLLRIAGWLAGYEVRRAAANEVRMLRRRPR
jgi:hypothetical protein